MSKSSKNTVNQRITNIVKMLLNGSSRDIILQNTSNLNISDRQIDTYIKKARLVIEKSVEKNINYDYAKAIRRYEELYQNALKEKDYRLALSVNKELTTLQGLFRQEIKHSGTVEFICSIPD